MSPPPEPVQPDYGAAWIGGIVPALLGDGPADWLPAPVLAARAVVLLVLDGLGWDAVVARGAGLPALHGLQGGPITTVAPATTSTALTSITTGLAPAEHGVIGYRMRVGGEILNVLQWQTAGNDRGPAPAQVQPHTPFLGRGVPLVTRSEFRDSGFTGAHLRGGTFVGWRTTAILVEHCRRLVRGGQSFVYAYYDGVDRVAHEYGLHDGFLDAELAAADRLVADLLAALPDDCALLVTADHGQVHVGAGGWWSLAEVSGMCGGYAGDGRFRFLYARPGASADLLDAARDGYGDVAWVLGRDELFDLGWLGRGASASVRGRVGDVVLAAHAPVAFAAPDAPKETELVSGHGSLTAAEMLVPLLAGTGTDRPV